jgi:chromosome segregation ATPase
MIRSGFWVLVGSSVLLIGCKFMDEPIKVDNMPSARVTVGSEQALVADQGDPALKKRFADGTTAGATDSALAWSQKYEELLKQQQQQTEKNQALVTENSDLKQTIDKLQGEMAKTKKELDEANVFLQDMHRELTQWKADVLGYREEMRQAQSAQMEALIRILKVLGAETTDLSKTQLEKSAPAAPPAAAPAKPEPLQAAPIGTTRPSSTLAAPEPKPASPQPKPH